MCVCVFSLEKNQERLHDVVTERAFPVSVFYFILFYFVVFYLFIYYFFYLFFFNGGCQFMHVMHVTMCKMFSLLILFLMCVGDIINSVTVTYNC
jgi:hypothetical protein